MKTISFYPKNIEIADAYQIEYLIIDGADQLSDVDAFDLLKWRPDKVILIKNGADGNTLPHSYYSRIEKAK